MTTADPNVKVNESAAAAQPVKKAPQIDIKRKWQTMPDAHKQIVAAVVIVVIGMIVIGAMQVFVRPAIEPGSLRPTAMPTAAEPVTPPQPAPTAMPTVVPGEELTVMHSPGGSVATTIIADPAVLRADAIGYLPSATDCLLISFAGPPPGNGWVCHPSYADGNREGLVDLSPKPTPVPVYIPPAPAVQQPYVPPAAPPIAPPVEAVPSDLVPAAPVEQTIPGPQPNEMPKPDGTHSRPKPGVAPSQQESSDPGPNARPRPNMNNFQP